MRWTEKQIEAYLAAETRELTGPAGQTVGVTMYHMQWITYDAARVGDLYTEAELVEFAQRRAREQGLGFTEAFGHNMDLLDHEFRRQYGQL